MKVPLILGAHVVWPYSLEDRAAQRNRVRTRRNRIGRMLRALLVLPVPIFPIFLLVLEVVRRRRTLLVWLPLGR